MALVINGVSAKDFSADKELREIARQAEAADRRYREHLAAEHPAAGYFQGKRTAFEQVLRLRGFQLRFVEG